jgi:F0F1-type ATP synthase membrane subunit c/vacuolar-type H+-ATPase subunit K
MRDSMAVDPEQKKRNLRMALILASIAAVFFIGFIVKIALLSK